jgi:hypothetical protein
MSSRGTLEAAMILCLLAPCFAGCSLLFTTGPEPNAARKRHPPDCTTSAAAPILDTVLAGLQVVRTGFAIAASDEAYANYPISREADVGFGVTFASLHLVSAVHGFSATDACIDAKRSWARRHSERSRRARPLPPRAAPHPRATVKPEVDPMPPAPVRDTAPESPPSPAIDAGVPDAPIEKDTPF